MRYGRLQKLQNNYRDEQNPPLITTCVRFELVNTKEYKGYKMKFKNTHLYTIIGMIMVVFVAVAVAQETKPKACCPATKAVSGCGGDVKGQCGLGGGQIPVYLDGPGSLLAQAEKLELTSEQKSALAAILAEARQKAVAVLTDDQVVALGDVPPVPVVLGKHLGKSCVGGAASSCASPCGDKKGCSKDAGQCSKDKACGGCDSQASCSGQAKCSAKKSGCSKHAGQCGQEKSCESQCESKDKACGECKSEAGCASACADKSEGCDKAKDQCKEDKACCGQCKSQETKACDADCDKPCCKKS